MMESRFIYDIRWENTYPKLVYSYTKAINKILNEPIIGKTVCAKVEKEKHCPGYVNLRTSERIPCRNNVLIELRQERCTICENLFGFSKGFLYHEYTNPAAKWYFSLEHYLYLAVHNRGIIKVGTANVLRREDRLYEQGAMMYCYIAKGTLEEIQYLENFISKTLNITQRHPDQQNLHFFTDNDINTYRVNLKKTRNSVTQLLLKAGYQSNICATCEIIDIEKNINTMKYLIDTDACILRNQTYFAGEIVSLLGDYIVLRTVGELYLQKKQNIIGHKLTTVNQLDIPREAFNCEKQLGFKI